MAEVLSAHLGDGARYTSEGAPAAARAVADEVRERLAAEARRQAADAAAADGSVASGDAESQHSAEPRYKIAVQCVVAERGGQGLHLSARCLWDMRTDGMASSRFDSEELVGLCVAFAVYHY